jgi:hypothetical protein
VITSKLQDSSEDSPEGNLILHQVTWILAKAEAEWPAPVALVGDRVFAYGW